MQAIQTKYLGATNYKGARIKAWCDAGSVTVSYDYGASDPHDAALRALCEKLDKRNVSRNFPACWSGKEYVKGHLKDGGRVYVFADASSDRVTA